MNLINRLPSSPLRIQSPYELLFREKPNYIALRTFGCLCFLNLRPYNKHKLQFRSTPCTFLGYFPQHKGYKCRDHTGKVYVSRHVTFHEHTFPFQTLLKPVIEPSSTYQTTSSKLLVFSQPRQTQTL